MLYAEYAAYQAAGGSMTAKQYAIWGIRASRQIDRLTYGRAASALQAHPEALSDPLADACTQIADLLRKNNEALLRAASGISGAATTDGYSESYGVDVMKAQAMARAACRTALADALGADPYNLLYAGVCCDDV